MLPEEVPAPLELARIVQRQVGDDAGDPRIPRRRFEQERGLVERLVGLHEDRPLDAEAAERREAVVDREAPDDRVRCAVEPRVRGSGAVPDVQVRVEGHAASPFLLMT